MKPKTSGDVLYVGVTPGQAVKTGAVIARLDATTAQTAVRNAQIALQSAQVTLQKLQLSQTTNVPQLKDDVTNAYQSAYNTLTQEFLSLPGIVDGTRGILYDNTLKGACTPNECQYANLVSSDSRNVLLQLVTKAKTDYDTAKSAYDPVLSTYRTLARDSGNDAITSAVTDTLSAVSRLSQAVKDEQNVLDAVVADMNTQAQKNGQSLATIPSQITAYQTAVSGYENSLNGFVVTLAQTNSTIQSAITALSSATLTNPLDVTSAQNTVNQRQSDLLTAQQSLADTVVRAPFDGVVATVAVQRGDSASTGTSVATIISNHTIAQINLNEVDVANVAVGQKATLTFDAISGLTLSGTVSQIDPVGAVSQGVVSYAVQVAMDTQDSRVKASMSTSVSIVTGVKADVLLVPGSAVRTTAGTSTVQVVTNAPQDALTASQGIALAAVPERVAVQIGASSDSQTEITSGLNESDMVVSRTVTATATTATTQSSAAQLRIPGAGGGFGGGAGR